MYKGIVCPLWSGSTWMLVYLSPRADDIVLFLAEHLHAATVLGLTFQRVTSSPQGPPNHSTYAGLHSNQILTVKVCHPPSTPHPPGQLFLGSSSPPVDLSCILADGRKGNSSFFQLSPLASTSRVCRCAICISPPAAVRLFVDWRLHSVSRLCIPDFCPIFHLHFSTSLFVFQHFFLLCALLASCAFRSFLHLRWSSPATTTALSLEISPTAFRDAFWR